MRYGRATKFFLFRRSLGGGVASSTFALDFLLLFSFFFLLSFVHRFQKNVTQAVKLKTKKRPKKLTPSDKKHVGATYPALPPPPPAFTILKAGASN